MSDTSIAAPTPAETTTPEADAEPSAAQPARPSIARLRHNPEAIRHAFAVLEIFYGMEGQPLIAAFWVVPIAP